MADKSSHHYGAQFSIKGTIKIFIVVITSILKAIAAVAAFIGEGKDSSQEGGKEIRGIDDINNPGTDPYFDGEYQDWQGTTYSKGPDGNWYDSSGIKYKG